MKSFRIGHRAMQLIVIGSALTFLLVIYNILNLHRINKNVLSIYNDRVLPLKQLKVISDAYAVSIVDCSHKVRNGNITWQAAIPVMEEAQQNIEENWKAYLKTYLTPNEKETASQTSKLLDTARTVYRHIMKILSKGKDPENEKVLEKLITTELYQKIDPLTSEINKLIAIQLEEAHKLEIESRSIDDKILLLFVLICIILCANFLLVFDRNRVAHNLKSKTEDIESANEELNAANEEFYATNEELNSANEELIKLRNNLEDIVDQRTRELNELSYLFERAIQTSSDGIWFMNVTPEKKFIITRVNPVIENSLKLYNKDLDCTKTIDELFTPEEAAYFNGRYSTCLETGETYNYEESFELSIQYASNVS